jgi:hypothetical protein
VIGRIVHDQDGLDAKCVENWAELVGHPLCEAFTVHVLVVVACALASLEDERGCDLLSGRLRVGGVDADVGFKEAKLLRDGSEENKSLSFAGWVVHGRSVLIILVVPCVSVRVEDEMEKGRGESK